MPDTEYNEEWRPVVGHETDYEVSNLGRLRKISPNPRNGVAGSIRRLTPAANGYLRITLFRDKKRCHYSIHRLVAEAFIGPSPKDYHVDHINGDKTNNRRDNLQYMTAKENTRKFLASELCNGVRSNGGKLTVDDVLEIKRLSEQGISRAELGRRFNVAAPHITQIVQGKKWKEVYA